MGISHLTAVQIPMQMTIFDADDTTCHANYLQTLLTNKTLE